MNWLNNYTIIIYSYLGVLVVEPLHRSQRGDEHRRLTVHRLHQLLLGSLQAQRQQVVPEDLPSRPEHLFNVGVLQQSSAHAHKLAALAGEQEYGAVSGVLSGSQLPPLGLDAVRERSGVFWGSIRARWLVGGQPPAQRHQRPDLPSGGGCDSRWCQHGVLLT